MRGNIHRCCASERAFCMRSGVRFSSCTRLSLSSHTSANSFSWLGKREGVSNSKLITGGREWWTEMEINQKSVKALGCSAVILTQWRWTVNKHRVKTLKLHQYSSKLSQENDTNIKYVGLFSTKENLDRRTGRFFNYKFLVQILKHNFFHI